MYMYCKVVSNNPLHRDPEARDPRERRRVEGRAARLRGFARTRDWEVGSAPCTQGNGGTGGRPMNGAARYRVAYCARMVSYHFIILYYITRQRHRHHPAHIIAVPCVGKGGGKN